MEYKGIWALSKEDILKNTNCVPGNLIIINKKITLELNGSFEEESGITQTEEYPIIYGFAKNGHFLVLSRCSVVNYSISFPGYSTQNIGCETCFDFTNIDSYNLNILNMTFEFNALKNYIENDTFKFLLSENRKSFTFDCIEEEKKIDFKVNDLEFNITRYWSTNENNKDKNKFVCDSKVLLSVKNLNIQSKDLTKFYYEKILYCLDCVTNFFAILTNRHIVTKQIKVFSESQKICEIFDVRNRPDLDDQISMQQKIFLDYKGLKKTIQCYTKKYNKYKNVVGLISEHIYEFDYEKIIRPKSSFINICGILEDYYRNIKKLTKTEENLVFEDNLKSIKSVLTDEQNLWLDETLKYNNQVSFRCVIDTFFNDIKTICPSCLKNVSNRKLKSLKTKIFNTRNWYTHYSNNENILKGDKLVFSIELLWILLRYLILNEFDIASTVLENTMIKDHNILTLLNKLCNN